MSKELWKAIKGYEGVYEISNLGRVKSLSRPLRTKGGATRVTNDRILKAGLVTGGYLMVVLARDNTRSNRTVHRLVAQAFKPNPENKPQVNHKNGIKTDNRECNLEWSTVDENMEHASTNQLVKRGNKVYGSKLTESQVVEICKLLDLKKLSSRKIASQFNVNKSTILRINKGLIWNWLTKRGNNT